MNELIEIVLLHVLIVFTSYLVKITLEEEDDVFIACSRIAVMIETRLEMSVFMLMMFPSLSEPFEN